MKSILDPKVNGKYPFEYTPAAHTDISATFERLRRKAKAKALANGEIRTGANVSDIEGRRLKHGT